MNNFFPEYFNDGQDFIKQCILGGIYDYYMNDSEELFLENLKIQPENWKYRTKNIKYTINSYGYRTKEFDEIDWKNSIVIIGCSTVFGVGVSDEDTLSYQLSKLFNRDVINLGVVGGSNQFMLDLSLALKNKYGIPYGIIFMWTSTSRFPYYSFERLNHIGVWNANSGDSLLDSKKYSYLFKYLYSETSHEAITFYNISQCAKNIWSDKTIFYEGSYFYETVNFGKIENFHNCTTNARDLLHPSDDDHSKTAIDIYKKITNNNE